MWSRLRTRTQCHPDSHAQRTSKRRSPGPMSKLHGEWASISNLSVSRTMNRLHGWILSSGLEKRTALFFCAELWTLLDAILTLSLRETFERMCHALRLRRKKAPHWSSFTARFWPTFCPRRIELNLRRRSLTLEQFGLPTNLPASFQVSRNRRVTNVYRVSS